MLYTSAEFCFCGAGRFVCYVGIDFELRANVLVGFSSQELPEYVCFPVTQRSHAVFQGLHSLAIEQRFCGIAVACDLVVI